MTRSILEVVESPPPVVDEIQKVIYKMLTIIYGGIIMPSPITGGLKYVHYTFIVLVYVTCLTFYQTLQDEVYNVEIFQDRMALT